MSAGAVRPLGFSFLYFGPRIGEAHAPWFERAAAHGYDGVELPVAAADDRDLAVLRRSTAQLGLRTTAVGFCGAANDPCSADASVRRAAVDHLAMLCERAAAIGAAVLAGPIHSAYGVWSGAPPTADERARCAEVLHVAGERAARCGVVLCVEPLNRFECYLLNTAADCAALVRAADHPNVTGCLDTHHAHLEENDVAAAIAQHRGALGHVQLSENHRGTPGTGQVDFARVLRALDEIGYDGWLVVEAFSRHDPAFGTALHVWRALDDGPDAVMAAGAGQFRR